MSEPKQLSEAATLEIRDKARLILNNAVRNLARDRESWIYWPPEVWDAHMDEVASEVVNTALNVAWRDWNDIGGRSAPDAFGVNGGEV